MLLLLLASMLAPLGVMVVAHEAPPTDQDASLLAQIARGEKTALHALYRAHGACVMALALRMLRDRAEAEEVVQETFIYAWQKAGSYDPSRGAVAAWLVTIARARALDRLRSNRRAARTVDAAAQEPDEVAASAEPAEQKQERARVLGALEALPDEQRAAIELAYFDGLSQSEIARKLGEPLGTIKTRVRLAMQKLATLLDAERGRG